MSIRTIFWVRASYPHLFEPRAIVQDGKETGEPRFSVNLHFANDADPAVAAAVRAVQEDIMAAWATKWPDPARRPPMRVSVGGDRNLWVNAPGYIRLPLVWGPAAAPGDPNATGWVLTASAKADSPPIVVEMVNGLPVQLADRTKAYPGAECHAGISIFAYDKGAQSKGISAGLNGIQLTGRDFPRFDGKPTVSQMFSPEGAPPPPPAPPGVTIPPAAPVAPNPFG